MGLILYGIKNCNTVKSAMQWLKEHAVIYEFHDYKSKGVSSEKLREWCKQNGWETLINKRGTTWRQLSPAIQRGVVDVQSAVALMHEKTSVIKRPVLEADGRIVMLGFDESEYKNVIKRLSS